MRSTKHFTRGVGIILGAATMAGCATDSPYTHAMTKHSTRAANDNTAKLDADQMRRNWCNQRYLDSQAGKKPGGARTIEEKQADGRVCEALRRRA